ncbi:hypothetical protein E4T56_gene5371 [Termitomyces sp. T112]|nr:hypothetical protein E4T56_gene5371 [Termitomyces sp. T112]KAH0586942.1 hypothetical protein H2248_005774 [Termitomyces sp. 'cryptogamus']
MSTRETRPPFPFVTFLLVPDILLALALALDLPKRTRVAFFVVFALVCYQGLQYTTGDKMQDYSMGSTIGGQFFTALHLLLLAEPIRHYRHFSDHDDPSTRSLFKKVYWTACIIHSPRGIGWNYQTPYVPDRPTIQRGFFIVTRTIRAVACLLIMDAAQVFIHTNPLFSGSTTGKASIASQGILYRCLNIMCWMSTPHAGVRMQYYQISAFSVALGFSTPADWPDPFGDWSAAYTVRNLWGRTWHQMMRRYLSEIGKTVTQFVGFKKGSLFSSYTQLLVGFIVSGMMHSFGDAMVGWKHLGASFPFFVVQVLGIIAEDTVIGIASRLGKRPPKEISRTLGYVWVFSWSMISFPLYIDWAVAAGLGSCKILPFSPIRTMLGLFEKSL